ncbi:Wzz/FepE/Etk N-terminal domain-containing protein, partial [Klebsiella pneumoniae]
MKAELKNQTNSSENEDIDIGRLFGELIDHRKLIIAVTTGFTVIAVMYTLLATPIYQADALIQVEQKQGNAILSNLTQMLPDAQPQSAPEIALLQSRMILGKTVDDLNLQAEIKPKYIPLIGRGLARIFGEKQGVIDVGHIYLPGGDEDNPPEVTLTVIDNKHYQIESEDFTLKGTVGDVLDDKGISLLIK